MTITEFLEARIAEDESVAKAASPGPWDWQGDASEDESFLYDSNGSSVLGAYGLHSQGFLKLSPANADYIERNNPARVLAECAAKRAIIAGTYWEHKERPSDAELHRSGAHPDYEYETTEGQRKRWDDADEPPKSEGWERNTERGRGGWDRFDYTEESYWRRLKPESERKPWKQYIPSELRAIAAVYADHPEYQQEWATDTP